MLLAGARELAAPVAAGQRALRLRRRGGDRRALDRRVPRGRRARRAGGDHLRQRHDRPGAPGLQHRHARARLFPPDPADGRARSALGHVRRRRAERRPRADPDPAPRCRRRRPAGRAAARRASRRRRRTSSRAGASCPPERTSWPTRARGRATRARPRSSICARSPSRRSTSTGSRAARRMPRRPCSRSAPTPTCRSGWPPARTRRDRGRVRAARCARPRRPAPSSTCELLSSAPARARPAGRPAIQLGLRAFERALGVRPALIRTGGTCRSSPHWPTGASRRSSPASALPDAQHPLAERAPAGGVRAARDRRGPGAVRGAGGAVGARGRCPRNRRDVERAESGPPALSA